MKHLYIFLFLIAFQSINAQVLWSDDFDNYPVGLLSNDPTGVTPGYGGWYVKTPKTQVRIVQETGRGNVMAIGWATFSTNGSFHVNATQKNIDVLWNNRVKTNNILKLEYDMYVHNYPSTTTGYFRVDNYLRGVLLPAHSELHCFVDSKGHKFFYGELGNNPTNFYKPSWIKVEMYIDFNTNVSYCYVPNLFQGKYTYKKTGVPDLLSVGAYIMGTIVHSNALIKYDNFKLSAVPSLPTYLNVDKFLTSKFNVFPNPATDIVTITNNENIGVEQIEIYDINGKNVKLHNYSNQNEIQLNISDLAAGTYMFHIKTNQGTAVKKVVKK